MNPVLNRFTALDVFRGMTICLMIIVNTPGNGDTTFAPLLHAKWDGFTPTDLVFPSFLFAVGNALSLVMNKWAMLDSRRVVLKILRRTFVIFLLGYLMYWFPFVQFDDAGNLSASPFSNTRVFGVLQRIALCYGISALMHYFLKERTVLLISIFFLLGYWLVLLLWGDPAAPLSLEGNAVLKLDRILLGDAHLYHGEGVAFDPEGLLSTFPAVVNVVGGYLTGRYLQRHGGSYETIARLMMAGAVLLFLAYCWNLVFPINKKLWTSSFVLHTVGLDCMILALIIYGLDYLKIKSGVYFFEVFGRNPLFIYLLSELGVILLYFFPAGKQSCYEYLYANAFSHAGAYTGSFLFALSFMLLCWLAGYWLDKRKIYIRV